MSPTYARAEVSTHNTPTSLWIIINNGIYDVSEFQKTHPGGDKSMSPFTIPFSTPSPSPPSTQKVIMSIDFFHERMEANGMETQVLNKFSGKDATKAF